MKISGFSLLELLITMAIIGILMTIATPVYTSHLVKSRRNLAEIALMHLGSQLENYYSLNDTYQEATLEKLGVNPLTDDHSYQLEIQSADQLSFLIQARPIGQQANQDKHCGALTLDDHGQKSNTGVDPPTECWQ